MPEDRRQLKDAPVVAPEPGTIWDLFAAALPGTFVNWDDEWLIVDNPFGK